MDSFREVVYELEFERDLRQAAGSPKHFEEIAAALEFALARDPELGAPVPDTDLRLWPIYPRDREWVVYYRFDDQRVELIGLRESEGDLW